MSSLFEIRFNLRQPSKELRYRLIKKIEIGYVVSYLVVFRLSFLSVMCDYSIFYINVDNTNINTHSFQSYPYYQTYELNANPAENYEDMMRFLNNCVGRRIDSVSIFNYTYGAVLTAMTLILRGIRIRFFSFSGSNLSDSIMYVLNRKKYQNNIVFLSVRNFYVRSFRTMLRFCQRLWILLRRLLKPVKPDEKMI